MDDEICRTKFRPCRYEQLERSAHQKKQKLHFVESTCGFEKVEDRYGSL